MSLFRVYVDGALFYHPQMSKLAITAARIEEDAENIDSMTLSAPHNHPYLSAVRPLASTIVCKKGDAVVFEGRALDNGTDFYNTHTWTCESCLAYLKDSVQPPYEYQGTLRGLLEMFIDEHNRAVEERKRFTLGTITVTDNNDYVSYSSIDFTVTLDAIRDKLIKTHGGYLRVRYVGGAKYLDYIADFDSLSPQTVEYGKNLLDVKISRDHTERVSVLLPLGAKIKDIDAEGHEYETDERVQITSVNGGKNYIVDEEAAAEIGMIWKTEIWEDVTVPGNLLTKARSRHPASLSGGQKQRLCIAVARMKDADIICFDEPTSGLDYQNMIAVSNLLLKLSKRGKTLFVVTHDYEFLMSTCTHVMNLEKGSIRDYYAVTKDSAHKVYETMFLG